MNASLPASRGLEKRNLGGVSNGRDRTSGPASPSLRRSQPDQVRRVCSQAVKATPRLRRAESLAPTRHTSIDPGRALGGTDRSTGPWRVASRRNLPSRHHQSYALMRAHDPEPRRRRGARSTVCAIAGREPARPRQRGPPRRPREPVHATGEAHSPSTPHPRSWALPARPRRRCGGSGGSRGRGVPMILVDANLLIYAHVKSFEQHAAARQWLDDGRSTGSHGSGCPGRPSSPSSASSPTRGSSSALWAWPGRGHRCRAGSDARPSGSPCRRLATREILGPLLHAATSRSNLVPDAHLAALAIEHGLVLCSTDADFARFPNLRWQNPLTG